MQTPFLNLRKGNHRQVGFHFLNNRENMNLISLNKSHVLCATTLRHKYQYIVAKCSTGAYIYYILVTILPIDIVT
jgi:hypothetical protein